MEKNVLDDALDDFAPTSAVLPADDRDPGKFGAPSAAAEAGSSSSGDASTAAPAPQAFDPLGKRKKGKSPVAGGPAFDPLKQSRAARQAGSKAKGASTPPAGSSGQSSKSSGKQQVPDAKAPAQQQNSAKHSDIDEELARGVAQLMADLAKAAPSGGEDAAKSSPHEREIASTLAALAAAVPSRGAEGGATSQNSAAQRPGEQTGASEGDADGSFASLADSIMQQLLSKDVLYQPMKDIGAKYPAWLATRRDSLPPEELKRYEAQYKYIRQICALYEEDPSNFGQLFTLIQEMQACGQPPEEIVQDLAPGLAFGEDGLPQLPATDNCRIC